jgi:hypothetical protein
MKTHPGGWATDYNRNYYNVVSPWVLRGALGAPLRGYIISKLDFVRGSPRRILVCPVENFQGSVGADRAVCRPRVAGSTVPPAAVAG